MIAQQDKPPVAAAQTRSFTELLTIHAEKDAAHNAAITAYGKVEARVFAGEIPKDNPDYIAAEAAEGDACAASCTAWCNVLDAPVSNAADAIAKLGVYLSKEPINLNSPDAPIAGTPMDMDEALKRVLRDLRNHVLGATAQPAGSALASWAAERDRLNAAANQPSIPDTEAIALYDRAAHLDHLIRAAPCVDATAAMAKLNWLRLAFTEGQTGDEELVLDQIAAYVTGLIDADPDAELLALGSELERRWAQEHRRQDDDLSDDELDAVCAHTREIAEKIDAAYATTLAGYRVKARALAWRHCAFNQPIDGSPIEAGQLLNDLMGVERWSSDGELKQIYERFKRFNRQDALLSGHTIHPLPPVVKSRTRLLSELLDGLRERSRQCRATTPEALRIKAIIALDAAPTAATVEHDEEDHQLARSLIADVLGLPIDFSDADRDALMIAEGLLASEDDAPAEHAALLAALGVNPAEQVAA